MLNVVRNIGSDLNLNLNYTIDIIYTYWDFCGHFRVGDNSECTEKPDPRTLFRKGQILHRKKV